jgi:hypothetical protein
MAVPGCAARRPPVTALPRAFPFATSLETNRPQSTTAASVQGVSPLTPIPSPLPGARGAIAPSATQKTRNPPLAPVKRGRGVGGEGPLPLDPLPT